MRPTGIPSLDFILHGGFPTDSTILLAGASGAGKTVFTMQWLFAGFKQFKEPGMYISLTEPIEKSIKNIKTMAFCDEKYIETKKIQFVDLRFIMKEMKLEGKKLDKKDLSHLIKVIHDLVTSLKVKRVVLDSITAMAYRLKDHDLIRTFIFELGTLLAKTDVNVILTSEVSGEGYSIFGVEEFISDGIIKLTHAKENNNIVRTIDIVKMRGVIFERATTTFKIQKEGIVFFKNMNNDLHYSISNERVSTGIAGVDVMTQGGYIKGTSILITGASGCGKTLSALQFIVSGLKAGKKAMYVAFEESRDQLIRNAKAFGWDLEKYEKQGVLEIVVSYPEKCYVEEHMSVLQKKIQTFEPDLFVLDSLSALGNIFSEARLYDFVSRLNGFLKHKLITSIFTNATASLLGSSQVTDGHLSTLVDQIMMMRYIEIKAELRHALLILKMRGSGHDKKLRELIFTDKGLVVAGNFQGFEGVLSGNTRKVSASVEEQLHALFVDILGPMGEKIFEEEKVKGLHEESVKKLIQSLGDQGILSVRRKSEFEKKTKNIFNSDKND